MNNKMYQFLLFVQPIFYISIVKGISLANKTEIKKIAILNSALISMVSFSLYSCGSILFMEKRRGTLELLIAAPQPLWKSIFYRALSYTIVSIISLIETITVAVLALDVTYNFSIGSFLLSLLMLILSISVLGCYFSIIFGFSINSFELQNLFLNPLLIIIGIFTVKAKFIEIVGKINPMSISIFNFKETLLQGLNSLTLRELVHWLVLIILFFTLFIKLTDIIEAKIRLSGRYHEFN